MLRMSIIYELILNYAEYLGSLSQKPLFVRGTRCLPKEVKFVLTLIKPISGGMITTRLKHGIILRSQSTTWLASIRGQRPWKCVKVFLTVNENLRILQYLFISHRYQYLIYILLIFDKHWKFLYKKKLPSVYIFCLYLKATCRECFLSSSLSRYTSYRNVVRGIFPGNAANTHLPFVLDDKPTVGSGTRLRNGNLIQCQYLENTIS